MDPVTLFFVCKTVAKVAVGAAIAIGGATVAVPAIGIWTIGVVAAPIAGLAGSIVAASQTVLGYLGGAATNAVMGAGGALVALLLS